MVIILTAGTTILLSILLVVALVNSVAGPSLKNAPANHAGGKVSIMVPARNEEHNIERCVRSIMDQDYPDFELLVLNDNSEDQTGNVLAKLSETFPDLQVLEGAELPPGWSGKNWACHQLAQHASGEIYVFTDADNWHEKNAISKSVSYVLKYTLDFFSVFPQQITQTVSEKLIVPFIDLLVYGSLPLWLTLHSKNPSLAAGCGQWIVMPSDSYTKLGGHAAVRSELVEDTALARMAKRKGFRTLTAAGTEAVYARMYTNAQQVWEGMSKTLFGLMNYKIAPFVGLMLLSLFLGVLPYILIWLPGFQVYGIIAIGLNSIFRLILAVRYKHPIIFSTLLHPLSVMSVVLVGMNSVRQAYTGSTRWKNRQIDINKIITNSSR